MYFVLVESSEMDVVNMPKDLVIWEITRFPPKEWILVFVFFSTIDIKQIKPVIHAGTQVIGKYIYISYHELHSGYLF